MPSVPSGIGGVAVTITMPTSTMASITAGTSDMAATTTPEISMLVKGSMAAKGFMVVTKVASMAGVAEACIAAEGSAVGFKRAAGAAARDHACDRSKDKREQREAGRKHAPLFFCPRHSL